MNAEGPCVKDRYADLIGMPDIPGMFDSMDMFGSNEPGDRGCSRKSDMNRYRAFGYHETKIVSICFQAVVC
ncbi:hypothetical protein C1H69_00515 [Billgrantia endophytica]|uniref:Uncharacterized protein n=1 Tax=Billgrantia endophytica TaxID=2033802 RepID=A0A2N7UE98_9GAMM|nr:hypothetical protein C1H69_00515 [Halomonas endophytica]